MRRFRLVLVFLISLFGSLLALYVGGYLMFIMPIRDLYVGIFGGGMMTRTKLALDVIAIFLASTVAGAIWVIFDIIASIFRDKED